MDSGKFVSLSGHTVTFTDAQGTSHTRDVDPKATVTLNGKKAALTDLKAGDNLSFSGDPATSVSASRP